MNLSFDFVISIQPEIPQNRPYVKPPEQLQTQPIYRPPQVQQTSPIYIIQESTTYGHSAYQTQPTIQWTSKASTILLPQWTTRFTTQSTTRKTTQWSTPFTTQSTTRKSTKATTPWNFPTSKFLTTEPQFTANYLEDICGVPMYKKSEGVGLINRGRLVGRGQLPWLVAYFYSFKYSNMFICGGSLISRKLVITAAHCIQEPGESETRKPELSTFYLGKNNIESLFGEAHYVASIAVQFLMHPLWNKGDKLFEHDIATVVLIREIEFNQFVLPICIHKSSNSYTDVIGKTGLVAGWGKTEFGDISVPSAIYTKIPVVSHEECLKSDRRFFDILSEHSFCAGIKNSDTGPCSGDSGKLHLVLHYIYYYKTEILQIHISNRWRSCY